jgi:caffeoyl-CoA O-methyltransferase
MAHKSFLSEALQDYVLDHWLREPGILRRLREETASHPRAGMQIPPDQGQLMQLLVRLTGARRCLEIGVFTGYSSLSVALALPPDGRIVALDVSEEFTSIARRYWTEAGVADRITLHLGPALETLDHLQGEPFDLAFIDADKENYLAYYEKALNLLKPNGLILIDNVLWDGKVADPSADDADTQALKKLNAALHADERIDLALLPIGDGVTVARKRRAEGA